MCSVATQPQIVVERQGKAPLDAGESTRATGDGVNLRGLTVSVSRLRTHNLARGHIHMYARADFCRNNGVSIGGDPIARPSATGRPGCKYHNG